MSIQFFSRSALILALMFGIVLSFGYCPAVLGGVVDLNNRSDGLYSPTMLSQDWNSPPWNNGVTQGRASIVSGADAYDGKSLRIKYPQGEAGPVGNNPPATGSGAQWRWELDGSYDEMIFEYKVKFADDFDFVLGGKLPGFVGGTANTGGGKPNGFDGWSARMMWEGDADAIQYVYHPDQPGTFGDIMPWNVGGQRKFVPGTWHTIRQRVVMNTPTQNDGVIQGWFDGELAFERQNIRFRDTNSFAIDTLYFSSFYGGSTAEWAPSKDEYIFFDDFTVSTSSVDFNADFTVDADDLAVWENGFGAVSNAGLIEGDADGDLDVDGSDFLAWQRESTPSGGLLSPLAVPEPSTGFLALITLISIFIGCRQSIRVNCWSARRGFILPAIVFVMLGASQSKAATVGDGNVETWKDGQTAAATLTVDDNFQSDHAWWTATANTFDVRFTWFVISGNVGIGNTSVNGNWSDFNALKAAGHDIQSHTVDHFPKFGDQGNFPSGGPLSVETNYTQAITDIEANVTNSDVLTLAYPFGLQAPNDKTLAGQNYVAARGVIGTLNTLSGVDYLNVNSLTTDFYGTHDGFPLPGNVPSSHFAYIPNLTNPVKPHHEGWLSVHSHGMTNDKKDAITELLTYLTATPGEFWVAPFTDVAQYAQERDEASLVTNVISADEIQFTLTDTLEDTRFYEPLTVKVRVDNAWSEVIATQGGQPLPVTLIQDGGEQFALINSVPDLGVVSLTQPVVDPSADFDVDSDIDGADFLAWQRGFGTLTNATLAQGDADFDEAVDAEDLAVWQSQYANVAVIATAVPEPTSTALLLVGFFVWHLLRN